TDPNPRTVSNAVFAQSGDVLSANHLTDWSFQWGQWVTHDMDKTRDNGAPLFIPVQPGDPLYNPAFPFIPFNRSEIAAGTGVTSRREVVNIVTSYIDASNVYGSDPVRAAPLRTFVAGKMKPSAGNLL